jgi:hypothetical protein
LSVTVAPPNAPVRSAGVGLQRGTDDGGARTITGLMVSLVNVTVCDAFPVFPHASVTVHVFVTEKVHPLPVSAPRVPVAVNPLLQLSVTLAVPNAPLICPAVGLQGKVPAGVRVIIGACVSLVNIIVCVAVPVLPQASVTVHVFVTEKVHPLPVSAPCVPVAVSPAEQLSVTVAVPNAPDICPGVGLHGTIPAGVNVITGLVVSLVKVKV